MACAHIVVQTLEVFFNMLIDLGFELQKGRGVLKEPISGPIRGVAVTIVLLRPGMPGDVLLVKDLNLPKEALIERSPGASAWREGAFIDRCREERNA